MSKSSRVEILAAVSFCLCFCQTQNVLIICVILTKVVETFLISFFFNANEVRIIQQLKDPVLLILYSKNQHIHYQQLFLGVEVQSGG